MSYKDALRAAIADQLNKDTSFPTVLPRDIIDIQMSWDDGDRYDPTYGDTPNDAPKFEIEVTLDVPGQPTLYRKVNVEIVFTALLRAVLETGL
jgi:hypothetical protein